MALADPTRREMIRQLAERGPGTATEFASTFPITRQAITKHLDVLHDAGLVSVRRSGREQRYTLTPEPLDEAMAWLSDVAAQWDSRLAALHRLLASTSRHDAEPPEKSNTEG